MSKAPRRRRPGLTVAFYEGDGGAWCRRELPTRSGCTTADATPPALNRAVNPSEIERQQRAAIGRRLAQAHTVYLTGCGTAYHAARAGQSFLRDFTARAGGRARRAGLRADALRALRPRPGNDALIVLSHSGLPTAASCRPRPRTRRRRAYASPSRATARASPRATPGRPSWTPATARSNPSPTPSATA